MAQPPPKGAKGVTDADKLGGSQNTLLNYNEGSSCGFGVGVLDLYYDGNTLDAGGAACGTGYAAPTQQQIENSMGRSLIPGESIRVCCVPAQ